MRLIDLLVPKVISAKTHGVIDYVHAGTNLLAGALLYRHDRRAATGAFLLGTGALANALLTDYSWGVLRLYSFETHSTLDYGLASMSAAMPKLMGVESGLAKAFFRMQGAGGTAFARLTNYHDRSGAKHWRREMRHRRRAA
jgi:hypothetical protein